MKRFRGGLVFKVHRLVYHSTLGSRIKKKNRMEEMHSLVGLEDGIPTAVCALS